MRATYSSTPKLASRYEGGKYKERTQRYLVVKELLSSTRAFSLQELFDRLNKPPYWDTLKHKDANGRPLDTSWLMQKAGGVRASIRYHLNALEKDGCVE